MKAFKEDWSAESMPLHKAKEPEGKKISSRVCPLCEKTVRTVDDKLVAHSCVSLKRRRFEDEYEQEQGEE